jgi:hypothetical protein
VRYRLSVASTLEPPPLSTSSVREVTRQRANRHALAESVHARTDFVSSTAAALHYLKG